jgi:hypothetical protein
MSLKLKIIYLYKRQFIKSFEKIKILFQKKQTRDLKFGLTQLQRERDYLKLWYNYYCEEKLKCDLYLIRGIQEEWDSLLYYIKLIQSDMYFKNSVYGKFTIIDINCQHMGFFKSPHIGEFAQKMQQIITKQV